MPRHGLRDRDAWEVRIEEHVITDRYRLPASVRVQYESTRVMAIAAAVRAAHVAAGVPPWRPWLRLTARHAEASGTVVQGG